MEVKLKEQYRVELNKFIDKLRHIGFRVPEPTLDIGISVVTDSIENIKNRKKYMPAKLYLEANGKIEFEIPDFMIEIKV